jgi:hypothetical protein
MFGKGMPLGDCSLGIVGPGDASGGVLPAPRGSCVTPTGRWFLQPVAASTTASVNASKHVNFIIFIFFLRLKVH